MESVGGAEPPIEKVLITPLVGIGNLVITYKYIMLT